MSNEATIETEKNIVNLDASRTEFTLDHKGDVTVTGLDHLAHDKPVRLEVPSADCTVHLNAAELSNTNLVISGDGNIDISGLKPGQNVQIAMDATGREVLRIDGHDVAVLENNQHVTVNGQEVPHPEAEKQKAEQLAKEEAEKKQADEQNEAMAKAAVAMVSAISGLGNLKELLSGSDMSAAISAAKGIGQHQALNLNDTEYRMSPRTAGQAMEADQLQIA